METQIRHPNLLRFEGRALPLDRRSPEAVHAVDFLKREIKQHLPISFSSKVVEACLNTIIGQPLHCLSEPEPGCDAPAFCATPYRRNVGVITEARVEAGFLKIVGSIYALHFPEIEPAIRQGGLGLCVDFLHMKEEMKTEGGIFEPDWIVFTGATLLRKDLCGFPETEIRIIQ